MLDKIEKEVLLSEQDRNILESLMKEGANQMSYFDIRRAAKKSMKIEENDQLRRKGEPYLTKGTKELLDTAIFPKKIEDRVEEIVKGYTKVLDLNNPPVRTAKAILQSLNQSKNVK